MPCTPRCKTDGCSVCNPVGAQLSLLGGDGAGTPAPSLPLGRTGAARSTDPATSREAAEANTVARGKSHHQVVYVLRRALDIPDFQGGLNDWEIAYALGRAGMRGAVAKRRGELCLPHRKPALVQPLHEPHGGGRLRTTDTTSRAQVHGLTVTGIAVADELGLPFEVGSGLVGDVGTRLMHLKNTVNERKVP